MGLLPSVGARASHLRGFSCCAAPALGPIDFMNCSSRAPELGLGSCTSSSKPSCYFVSLFRRMELYTQFLKPETQMLFLVFPSPSCPAPHPSPCPSSPFSYSSNSCWRLLGAPCLPLASRHAVPPFPSWSLLFPGSDTSRPASCSRGMESANLDLVLVFSVSPTPHHGSFWVQDLV